MADHKGRREEATVFFLYDHNMLKKEEDDLKDAILFFTPEDVSADDQCALCGQLMGMCEFLTATLSEATPKMYRFEHKKFALKRIGSYSLGLQGPSSVPDSLLKDQLDRMYSTFITFCGSVDSLRLRFKESHAAFLQELSNIWKNILTAAGLSSRNSVSEVFGAVPYVDLPKSGAHLFLQAAHLLQSCQKRPYVMAGTILYKNGVLCTQLPPELTRQLTYLQNQMPHISRTTEFDLPVGCRIITMFLTDKELQQICPPDPLAKRHCKTADFRARRENDRAYSDATPGRRPKGLARRATCPNIGTVQPGAKSGGLMSEMALNSFLRSEQRKLVQVKQDAMGVDQMSWRKNTRPNVSLSHVPIEECQSGESPNELEKDMLGHAGEGSNLGETNTGLDVPVGGNKTQLGEDSETTEHLEETQSQKPAELLSETERHETFKHASMEHTGASQTLGNTGDSQEHPQEIMEPSISDLEDNECSDAKRRDFEHDSGVLSSHNNSADHSNVVDKSSIFKAYVNKVHEVPLDSSLDEDEKVIRSYISSDDRTVTLSKTYHHSVLNHKVDVHAQGIENKDDGELTADVRASQAEDEKSESLDDVGIEDSAVRVKPREIKEIVEDNNDEPKTDTRERVQIISEHNTSVIKLGIVDDYSNGRESERSNNDIENRAILDICSKTPETQTIETIDSTQTLLPQSTENTEIVQDSDKKSSIMEANITTKLSDACDKENRDLNEDLLEDSPDDVEESEIDTEEESGFPRNENPCINCLEVASKNENGRKDLKTMYCEECLAKLPPGKKNNNQEVIDFGEHSRNGESEGQTEENHGDSKQEESAKDGTELLITSSFSSDVSTDSSISRYWTQEMDGLNDVTVYVQCHSDISLLLVLDNPDKYQENLFHALWKGSLAQLADLDYYIKECMDSDDDDKLSNYNYAKYNHDTRRLTGNIGISQEETNQSAHLGQMLATLHSEFELHPCLSDVNLRSQFNCCYGHHNQINEMYFQPEGQQKPSSGLPTPRDPSFALEHTVRSRLTKDRKISMI